MCTSPPTLICRPRWIKQMQASPPSQLPSSPMTTMEDHPSSSACGRIHRFLSLPAVRLCPDAASAPSLLRAVLALAKEITDSASSFGKDDAPQRVPVRCCRRGAQRAVHVARLLLAFLEGLLHCGGQADGLPLLAITELYVAFQKLRALLGDCAVRGARILLLMSTHRVEREFRAFHESVATAVDSLLLPSLKATDGAVDTEAVELAELVVRQTRRAAEDVAAADPEDEGAADDVRAILAGFERGVPPGKAALRRVTDYLRIQTWADSDAEAAFLEGQIGLAAADPKSAAPYIDLLHGLRGLMLYARAVLFDAVESVSANHQDNSSAGGESPSPVTELAWLDLKDLRCPISLDLMTDPVTISTGQTYNRASIVRWLRDGNQSCPVTGQPLGGAPSTDHHLVPNLAVRNIIHRFCQALRVKIPEQTEPERKNKKAAAPAGSSTSNKVATGAMRLVATHLVRQLSEGSSEAQYAAAREARLLSKSGAPARNALADAGAAPSLLQLLAAAQDKRVQDDAAAAVMNLSKHPEGRRGVFEAGGLVSLLGLLADDAGASQESRANAAGALFYLASADDEYRRAVVEAPGAVQGLVDLLKTGTHRGKKHALTAILALLASPANNGPVIAAGAVPNMIGLLASERDDIVTDAVAAVASMVVRPQGTQAVLDEPSGVRCLVEVLRSSAPAVAKESCISALTALCTNGGAKAVGRLNMIPALMPSLYSLLTESSPAASKKASSLIRIIHRGGHGAANDDLRVTASSGASQSPGLAPQLSPHRNTPHLRRCLAVRD